MADLLKGYQLSCNNSLPCDGEWGQCGGTLSIGAESFLEGVLEQINASQDGLSPGKEV